MGYANTGQFQTDFVRAQERAKRVHGETSQTKPVDWNVGWKLYQHTNAPALALQTFGRHITGQKARELMQWKQANPGADQLPAHLVGMNHGEKFFKNFGVVNDTGEGAEGSILLMGGNKWNFTINDTWILGGVHAKLPFYPASFLTKDNLFHATYIMSITGRELLGLCMFGYKEVKGAASIGSAMVCKDTKKAEAARLVAYAEAIGEIQSWDDMVAIFTAAGLNLT